MAKNDFKPFATGKGANVTSQPDWEALPALLSGFTAGKASSAQVNKALRQASFIAAALAQYTAGKSGQDVLDDGDLSSFIAKMSAAFGKDFQTLDATLTALAGLATGADKLPYFTGNDTAGQTDLTSVGRDIIGKASIADILTYLGLGETAKQAAGALQKSQNGGDIPDKKQFTRTIGAVTSTTITLGESGWFKIATVVMPQATSTAVIKLYGGAGFNAGSPEQAAISELVLRAGNGSPVGITATLWRRSPAAANEVAWVNTSGDTYDIYINIGQYAYWLIAQYDYTGNANVTLHSTPEYSSVQPGNSTSGQTYTLYNSLMKPTAGDVGALSVNGGRLNGSLGIGTDNALGGNSIVFGDNDTGFKWHSDGVLGIYANNARVGYIDNAGLHMLADIFAAGVVRAGSEKKISLTSSNNSALTATFNLWGSADRPTVIELDDDQGWHLYSQRRPDGGIELSVNGNIYPGNYSNFDARYVQNIQRGAPVWPGKVDEYGPNEAPAGCFLTQARHDPTTAYGVTFAYRPLQMFINGAWRTING
ncbi:TPA: phage tail protein [Salmonella enterica]|nr:phage tail protein [Salmonella enterica]